MSVAALAAQVNRINKNSRFDTTSNLLSRELADDALRIMQLIVLLSGDPMTFQKHAEIAQRRASDPVGYVMPQLDAVTSSVAIYGDTFGLPKAPIPPPLRTGDVPDFVKDYAKNHPIRHTWDGWMYASVIGAGLVVAIGAGTLARRLSRR